MSHTLTDTFINGLYDLSRTDFPEQVVHQAKRCLLDYLGATLAGARMMREKGNRLLDFLGATQGNVTAIGFDRRTGLDSAAFLNGLSAHVAELDDGVISGIVHPGSPILSALLPVAESANVNGIDFLRGIVTGYEAAVKIANAIQPSHKMKGYHASGTCGTIGAALGIAAMLGYSKSKMKNALSSAAVSASGSLKVLEDGSELKPFNVGCAAQKGLLAAAMSHAGFPGPDDVLSGNMGFLTMMSDKFDLSKLKFDNSYSIMDVYMKPYAACRYCHPAIEAALKMRSTCPIHPDTIESVDIYTYFLAVSKHDHTSVNGVSSAKMSIPYCFAVAMITGKAGLNEYSAENINNENIYKLTKKIKVHSDDQLTALFPEKSVAIATAKSFDGQSFSEKIDLPKGEPTNPLNDEELQDKFISLAAFGNRTSKQCDEMMLSVWRLEKDLPHLFTMLRG